MTDSSPLYDQLIQERYGTRTLQRKLSRRIQKLEQQLADQRLETQRQHARAEHWKNLALGKAA